MNTAESRAQVLASFGANASEVAELLAYNQNVFQHDRSASPLRFPLEPEAHVAAWQTYADESARVGVFDALKKRLVQFSFPIREGMSQSEDYRAATRRGESTDGRRDATGLILNHHEDLALMIYPSLAGLLPVLIAGDRQDFVSLLQALLARNEPKPIPDSQGATMVAGFNNWDRVRQYRVQWEADHPADSWEEEFQRLVPRRELYQDRFMILSRGPYAAVPAQAMGLGEDEWRRLSLIIRLEHECTHYFTRRVLDSMRNNLIDELIADYRGIVAATGSYRADWALRFLGLEAFPAFREGGRLQNYRGVPALSDGAFRVLQALVVASANHLEQFDHAHAAEWQSTPDQARLLLALTYLTAEELASEQAPAILEETWERARRTNG